MSIIFSSINDVLNCTRNYKIRFNNSTENGNTHKKLKKDNIFKTTFSDTEIKLLNK